MCVAVCVSEFVCVSVCDCVYECVCVCVSVCVCVCVYIPLILLLCGTEELSVNTDSGPARPSVLKQGNFPVRT